jgi:hypothetical protein
VNAAIDESSIAVARGGRERRFRSGTFWFLKFVQLVQLVQLWIKIVTRDDHEGSKRVEGRDFSNSWRGGCFASVENIYRI